MVSYESQLSLLILLQGAVQAYPGGLDSFQGVEATLRK